MTPQLLQIHLINRCSFKLEEHFKVQFRQIHNFEERNTRSLRGKLVELHRSNQASLSGVRMQNHTTRQKKQGKTTLDAKSKQCKTTLQGKKNKGKPRYEAKKQSKTTPQSKKTMKNHTEMQNHATMKTKDGTKSS